MNERMVKYNGKTFDMNKVSEFSTYTTFGESYLILVHFKDNSPNLCISPYPVHLRKCEFDIRMIKKGRYDVSRNNPASEESDGGYLVIPNERIT